MTFLITPIGETVSGIEDIELFVTEFNSEGQLENVSVGKKIMDGNTLVITENVPESDNYKIMLWDKNLVPLMYTIED